MKTSEQNEPKGGVEGPGWCSICQTDCTTKEVLEQHKDGKKHKKRLQKQELQVPSGDQEIVNENVVKSCSPMPFPNGLAETNRNQNVVAMESQTGQQQLMGNEQQADEKQNLGGKAQSTAQDSNLEKRKQGVKGTADDIAHKRKKLLDVGTSIESVKVCSLCNVVCNSQTVFDSHLSGRKHAAHVKNSDEVDNPASAAQNDAKIPAVGVEVGGQDMNAD